MLDKNIYKNETGNIFCIGGEGGNRREVGDIANEKIVFCNGSIIDSITIGKTKYGGDGGSPNHYIYVPTDGVFYVKEIWTSTCHDNIQLISYLDITAKGAGDHPNGQHIKVGKRHDNGVQLMIEQNVKLLAIHSGSAIDKLEFETISS